MSVSFSHLFSQGPVISSLIRTAMSAGSRPSEAPALPTPPVEQRIAPRPRRLIDDYLRHIGSDPSRYKGILPSHLWPQWGFPLAAETLRDVPYDLKRVLNGGCAVEFNAPLPDDAPLQVRAWLDAIDDDGSRALLTQKVITGTADLPDAVVATLTAYVPLKKKEPGPDAPAVKKEKPRVPEGARLLARQRIRAGAGWDFALLTGDVNPVHWVAPYARAAGFKGPILHGFSTLSRALAALETGRLAGDPARLAGLRARFVKPVPLPTELGFFVAGSQLFAGSDPGGPAFMTMDFQIREE